MKEKILKFGIVKILLIALAVVLVLVIFLVCSKTVFNKKGNNNNKPSVVTPTASATPTKGEKEISLDDKKISYLVKFIELYNEYLKYNQMVENVYNIKKAELVKKDNLASSVVFNLLARKDVSSMEEVNDTKYTEEQIKNEYKKIFGEDESYVHQLRLSAGCNIFHNVDGTYKSQKIEKCVLGNPHNYPVAKLAYAKNNTANKNDIIEIYQYVIYNLSTETIAKGCYADSIGTKLITKPEVGKKCDAVKEDLFNEHKDEAELVKFVFTKDENNNYVFTSIEKVK